MVENQAIDSLKERINILDVIARDGLTVVQRGNKYSTQEHDSLILYPATNSWAWFSQSDQHGKTLGGDVYQWYMHSHGCNFSEAYSALAAMAGTLPPATVTVAHRQTKTSAQAKDYRQFAAEAMQRLQSAEGEPVAAYLAGRGISLQAAKHCGLGAHHYNTASEGDLGWAVTFPYVNTSGQTVVNMRLIGCTGKDKCRHWGQRGGLFGVELCQPHQHKYLFSVEGEINDVSVWIASSFMGVDVVSIGSNTSLSGAIKHLAPLAGRYRRLFAWTDEAGDTKKILAAIPGAIGYKSPKPDGQKVDANDMLQRGLLTGYIATLLERHADRSDAQRLYAALYQRHQELAAGLDEQTFAVTERLAEKWRDK